MEKLDFAPPKKNKSGIWPQAKQQTTEEDFPSLMDTGKETTKVVQAKRLRTSKKKGVEMRMMFRDHHDPLYYDAKANDKVFVPVKALVSDQLPVINRSLSCVGGDDRGAAQVSGVVPGGGPRLV